MATDDSNERLIMILLIIILPPAAVYYKARSCNGHVCLNIILLILFVFPVLLKYDKPYASYLVSLYFQEMVSSRVAIIFLALFIFDTLTSSPVHRLKREIDEEENNNSQRENDMSVPEGHKRPTNHNEFNIEQHGGKGKAEVTIKNENGRK
ncbi:proteolipid membrane potential modulator domain-containing protein [Ditylenchus destructor]|nr:proteolipid membrane potential modulator domain-containing protein [Ditylenchus destructor]